MGTIRSQDAEDWLEKAIGPITSTRPIGGKRWNGSSAGLSGFEHEESFVVYSCRCRETEEMQQNPTVKMLAACIGGAEKEFLVKTSSHKVGLQSSPTRSPPPRSSSHCTLDSHWIAASSSISASVSLKSNSPNTALSSRVVVCAENHHISDSGIVNP